MIDRISKLRTGISLSKQVFVGYRQYLKAFMKLTPAANTASGKILIVDDFITGGTTIKEMRRLLDGKSFAITLFNVVGIDPDAEPDENDPTV
jgi:adenine/guanine phosphoribosyltransferase-like PRPP-binding protein